MDNEFFSRFKCDSIPLDKGIDRNLSEYISLEINLGNP
jgi:hypothetical protein